MTGSLGSRPGPLRAAAALALTTALAVSLLPGAAPAASAPPTGGHYRNPLAPRVPGDGTVDSCADPTVLRGRGAQQGSWHMFCTTDPLNDEDVDGAGDLRFHRLPMLRSRDLVNWRYEGDALDALPEWAADGAGIWAPDIVHSRATDRYYLTFTVTDTDDSLRGPDACASTGDSAIGVAVSRGPTGPWTVADRPLVMPRPDPATPCDFFWTFDPDVLGDDVGRRSVLYYGSYYGGVHAAPVRFDRGGARTTGAATPVVIGNRYEGTTFVPS